MNQGFQGFGEFLWIRKPSPSSSLNRGPGPDFGTVALVVYRKHNLDPNYTIKMLIAGVFSTNRGDNGV